MSLMKLGAHMFRRIILIAISCYACNNYGLRDKLENPGGVGTTPGLSALTIFVTASSYAANLSIVGADNRCKFDQANPLGSGIGNWRALLVYNTRRACSTPGCSGGAAENVNWALHPLQNYTRPDGTFIGRTNESGLLTFPLAASFSTFSGYKVWTGIGVDWLNSSVCFDWTTTTSGNGIRGAADARDITAISEAPEPCASSLALVCAEQP